MSVNLSSDELKKFADNGVSTAAIRRTVDTYRRDGWSDDAIRRKIDDKLSMYDTTGLNEAQLNARAKLERGLAARENNPTTGRATEPMSDADEQFFKNFFKKADAQQRMDEARKDVSTYGGAARTSGERILNSATLGGYGALNDLLGGNFDERNAAGQENLRNAGTVGKVINTASNIANDVGAGLPAGSAAWNLAGRVTTKPLARTVVSAAGLGGTSGFLNARGSVGDRLASGAVGAGVSAAMAPAFYWGQKVAGKALDKIMSKASSKHASARYADVAGDMNKIADDTGAFRAVRRGIKADDDIADLVRNQTDDLIARQGDDVSAGVIKVLDGAQLDKNGHNVSENLDLVRESYRDFIKEYGNRPVDKRELAAIIKKNPEISSYIKAAQTHGPTTGMAENSFGVLHEANRRMKMDLRDRMVNSSSKLQDKSYASNALDKLLDTKVGERAYLDKAFRRSKLKFDLIDAIGTANRSETSNFANKLLNNDLKSQVAELYNPETADKLAQYLRTSSRQFNKIKGLNSAANRKLGDIGTEKRPFWREAVESIGSMVGQVLDFATANYRNRMNANVANRILLGDTGQTIASKSSPKLAAVLAGAMGNESGKAIKTGRDNMDEMEYVRRALKENGLSAKDYDRYFHNKTQYENAQRGIKGLLSGQAAGVGAEIRDLPRTFKRTGYSVPVTLADIIGDLTFNKNGAINGIISDVPANNSRYLESQKTNNMRLLEQILRGGN